MLYNVGYHQEPRRLVFHLFSALTEFERSLIWERIPSGPTTPRARGHKGGCKPALPKADIHRARRC
ncbi:hypothetical protein SAMN04488509_1212 [Aquimonas voraii]|uniref:Resolvase/invertase-type recombinase catalytic domain-containing protein n=1 Tax=Aquimonas voraii TaxID=265719 RepID=A0A1G7A8J7_9GAMM|nr:hypothetical protein SAMN04488509_1212 [Aquimonas voraii]